VRIQGDDVILDDGTIYYANNGIIGIDPRLSITEGYDGGFSYSLTKAHRREIAEYMISLWTRVRDGEPEKREYE
jgi:hypothetical protein